MRVLEIDGGFNIRDLGGYETPTGPTAYGAFLRAASLDRLTEAGRAALQAEGLKLVVDLRREGEGEARHPFEESAEARLVRIPLYDKLDPHRLVTEAGAGSLLTLYREALETRAETLVRIFSAMSEAPAGVVLFHCMAGKDRTGIIAALLLEMVGAAPTEIAADYAASAALIEAERAYLLHEVASNAAERARMDPLMESRRETMLEFLEDLRRQGGAAAYLRGAGLGAERLDRLKARMLRGAAA